MALALTAGLATTGLSACAFPADTIPTREPTPIVSVALSDTIEHELVSLVYAHALKRKGYRVEILEPHGSSSDSFASVDDGSADLTAAFTGDVLARFAPGTEEPGNPEAAYRAMVEVLPPHLRAGAATEAQDKPALVVSRNTSDTWGLKQMSDLAGRCDSLRLAATPRIAQDAGMRKALRAYECEFADVVTVGYREPGDVQRALRDGAAGVGLVESTDPVLFPQDMVTLNDDEQLVPAESIVPVFAADSLDADQVAVLDKVSRLMTTSEVKRLNAAVESGSTPVAAVANYWLDEHEI